MYDRLKHITHFAFHQFGLFGTRWYHGFGTFLLVVGCFSTAAYITNEYFVQGDAFVMVGSSIVDASVMFACAASEYCKFTNGDSNETWLVADGGNFTLEANNTVWMVELLTLTEFHVRKTALSIRTPIANANEFDVQYFPPVSQLILAQFTLGVTKDYRESPPRLLWSIENWGEYDEYALCANASHGFDEEISYTCGALELHFSPETYAKRYRLDSELANTAFFIVGSWMVNLAWMWALVHGLDAVKRTEELLEKLDKRH